MRRIIIVLLLGSVIGAATPAAQSSEKPARDANVLATVRIPAAVMAGGMRLPPGTYQVRLTADRPTPLAGQSPNAQRYVEFVMNDIVVAREVAEVLADDDLPAIGASSVRAGSGTRVEMLKSADFLRVSARRDNDRYLIYLPVVP